MPILTLEGPIITDYSVKKKLVVKLTDVLCEALPHIHREAFVVIIHENPAENIGSGGECISEKMR
jgi:4-oxalocrotonate tautomerase family enzyme